MNCVKFQDSLSDYLEGALDPRARAECAAHRLICGECRELYNDVRGAVQALNSLRLCDAEPEGLPDRIIAHTTTGEMLSCGEFDRLLERYFDGVILAPTFQTFQSHFEHCLKCHRLLNGIEEAIVMLQEAKEAEVEVPGSLHDRIVAATIGRARSRWIGRAKSSLVNFTQRLMSPQMAVAAMIIALISLMVISRFGSVGNLTTTAEQKVESLVARGHQKINGAGAMARSGFQRVSYGVNTFLFSGAETAPTVPTEGPAPTTSPEPGRAHPTPQPPRSDHAPDPANPGNRDAGQKRPNRSER
ncbi:MAG TPA: zf-HC2 domain-containing protein [Blastocatellia bacterium]|jgi:predicted anti-sigma-YlaC factor YlaD|nr:zf-HC2 domain-containing protein [Blastocatellia bacterium]